MEALRRAVLALEPAEAESLLQAADACKLVHQQSGEGQTLLHDCAALLGGSLDVGGRGDRVLELLLCAGADPASLNSLGESALTLAARAIAGVFSNMPQNLVEEPRWSELRLAAVSRLLEAKADADVADDFAGETPLMEAACGGDATLCTLLLDCKADPTRLSVGGKLARDFVSQQHHRRQELLEVLAPRPRATSLVNGVVGYPAPEASSPSYESLPASGRKASSPDTKMSDQEEVQRLLVAEAGAPKASSQAVFCIAASASASEAIAIAALQASLKAAAAAANLELFQALLYSTDRVTRSQAALRQARATALFGLDITGQSLLHHLASAPRLVPSTREAVVRVLASEVEFETCSDAALGLDTRNKAGETALMLALRAGLSDKAQASVPDGQNGDAEHCFYGAARVLLEARADPDCADKPMEETSLMEAVCACEPCAVQLLLRFRADPDKTSVNGLRACDFLDTVDSPQHELLLRLLRGEYPDRRPL